MSTVASIISRGGLEDNKFTTRRCLSFSILGCPIISPEETRITLNLGRDSRTRYRLSPTNLNLQSWYKGISSVKLFSSKSSKIPSKVLFPAAFPPKPTRKLATQGYYELLRAKESVLQTLHYLNNKKRTV